VTATFGRGPTDAPSADVVSAFGGDPARLTHLSGGQGASWRAGSVVLKRVDDEREIAWLAAVLEHVAEGPEFRVARPVTRPDGSYAADGWSATCWLEGAHEPSRFEDALAVSGAFHRALADVPATWPEFLRDRATPWAVGDRAAWGEQPVRRDAGQLRAVLDRLEPLRVSAWAGSAPQVIHADLGGNVLFADGSGLPPAIIDVSPYYRPRPFAEAVLVADAVAWDGAPLEFAERFVTTGTSRREALGRAVVFRLVAALDLWGADSARVDAELHAYQPIVALLDLP
jgi:uncharacterized protein (TIGR02569 family)